MLLVFKLTESINFNIQLLIFSKVKNYVQIFNRILQFQYKKYSIVFALTSIVLPLRFARSLLLHLLCLLSSTGKVCLLPRAAQAALQGTAVWLW